jgi:hypothetical protein
LGSVPFAFVGAGDDGAELVCLGTSFPTVAVVGVGTFVGAVTGADGVVVTDVLKVGFTGLTGETGLVTLVGFDKDFTQVFDEVTHAPLQTGCP